jgi:hypothetical protein
VNERAVVSNVPDGAYATARITLATFSTISPIWSSLTIGGSIERF